MPLSSYQVVQDNYQIVTSSTRPSAPWFGLAIFETDTSREYVYDGSGISGWRYRSGGTDPTAARAYATGATSVGTTLTTIVLAGESYDYGNNFGASAYVCPRAGLLEVHGRVDAGAPTDGQRMLVCIANNSFEVSRGMDIQNGGTTWMGGHVSDIIAVAQSDVITLCAQMATGTAKNTSAQSNLVFMTCRMVP